MAKHEKFNIKDLDQLKGEMKRLGVDFPLDSDFSVLGEKLSTRACEIPNRFVVHPMEGFDSEPDGSPGELSFRRYKRYAEGGSGLIWFEATAVYDEARSNAGQFYLHDGNVENFARLVEGTRKAAREARGHEIVCILQMTHSGRYSKPGGKAAPMIAHRSPILDPRHNLPEDYPVLTDEYLDRLSNDFVAMARLAAEAGFDVIDLKICLRYLLSEILASHTRAGKYGGCY
ncbi:MAG: hypothetical protein JXR97_08625 [Planctomycetes bacterium]|nr:hypothetical protein [Planctomycetota bacterium]